MSSIDIDPIRYPPRDMFYISLFLYRNSTGHSYNILLLPSGLNPHPIFHFFLIKGFMDYDRMVFHHIPMRNEALIINNVWSHQWLVEMTFKFHRIKWVRHHISAVPSDFLWSSFAEPWCPVDMIFHNCYQKEYHLDYELVRDERKAQGITQEST